jgi:hypothetical protein
VPLCAAPLTTNGNDTPLAAHGLSEPLSKPPFWTGCPPPPAAVTDKLTLVECDVVGLVPVTVTV